jgi:drug/metabolite transporter (DMT)-like permease
MTFMGLKYLPSSKVTLIINIHPLLVAIIAYLLLREVLTKLDIGCLMGSFLGIVLFSMSNTKSKVDNSTNQEYILGIGMIATATISVTISAICLRVINQHIHPVISPFYISIITGVEMSILYILERTVLDTKIFHFEHLKLFDVFLFLISGVFDYSCQLFKSMAYKYADASIVTPFMYSQMIFLLIADVFLFEYQFTKYDILGGILVTV